MRAAAALVLFLLGPPALAGDLRSQLLDLLGAYEDVPAPAQLEALGPGVDAELMAIADDPAIPATRRARATTALQTFPSPTVDAWLDARLRSPDTLAIVRRKATWSLAAVEHEVAVPALVLALADGDVQLRIAAAQALATVPGDAARQALAQRLEVEPDAACKDAISKAMGSSR